MKREELTALQQLPLDVKILKTKQRIKEFYERFNGQVYVSFSGGKDSTVLLDIVRKMYFDVKAVYVDTGLEFPEIKQFVKTYNQIEILNGASVRYWYFPIPLWFSSNLSLAQVLPFL